MFPQIFERKQFPTKTDKLKIFESQVIENLCYFLIYLIEIFSKCKCFIYNTFNYISKIRKTLKLSSLWTLEISFLKFY